MDINEPPTNPESNVDHDAQFDRNEFIRALAAVRVYADDDECEGHETEDANQIQKGKDLLKAIDLLRDYVTTNHYIGT